MNSTMYWIILTVLPLALNVALYFLALHTKKMVSLAYVTLFLFDKIQEIEYNEKWWIRSSKTIRNSIHIIMFFVMHGVFWLACGMSPISHIAALFSNIIYWSLTNKYVCMYAMQTVVEWEHYRENFRKK